MIRHVVLMNAGDDVLPVIDELDEFCASFDGVVGFSQSANVAVEREVMHGYRHGFIVDFANPAARDAYLADPTHQAIGAKLIAQCEGGLAGLLVYDFEFN